MKRFFLLCMILSVAIIKPRAQGYSDFWSIKAGVNFANFNNFDYSSDCQTGFNVGINRAFSLSDQMPVYIQSGLAMEMKGAKNSFWVNDVKYKNSIKSYALEVPLLINFGINISSNATLHPFVGVFYSFALGGEIESNGESTNPYKKSNVTFEPSGTVVNTRTFDRSDFGIRMGIDFKYTRYSIGVAYDAGLMNIYAKEYRNRNYEASSGSFSINLGYYFQ